MQNAGHTHQGGPGMTQNQGNVLGDRPCVRQSRLYREHVGGNTMKDLMGQGQLKWDTNHTEGAYQGGRVFDHNDARNQQQQQAPSLRQQKQQVSQAPWASEPQQQQQQVPSPRQFGERQAANSNNNNAGGVKESGFRRGSGCANKQTYNILTGQ